MLDTPVEIEEGPIGPVFGAITGGFVALIAIGVLESRTGLAGIPVAEWNEAYRIWGWLPFVGAFIGFLYASSTLMCPKWVSIKLGTFFGVFLWVLSSVVLKHLLIPPFNAIAFSKESLGVCLFYGFCMGLLTEVLMRRAALAPKPVALD